MRDMGNISKARCEAVHGVGNCEYNNTQWYQKCKPGFRSFDCCICLPTKGPDCSTLGFNPGLEFSCTKKIIIGEALPCIS